MFVLTVIHCFYVDVLEFSIFTTRNVLSLDNFSKNNLEFRYLYIKIILFLFSIRFEYLRFSYVLFLKLNVNMRDRLVKKIKVHFISCCIQYAWHYVLSIRFLQYNFLIVYYFSIKTAYNLRAWHNQRTNKNDIKHLNYSTIV